MDRSIIASPAATCRTSSSAWTCPSAVVILLSGTFATLPGAEGARAAQQDVRPEGPRPIRALYVTGGGFHDFVTQETILPPGVAQRIRIDWTIDHSAGKSTDVLIDRHRDADWTKAFDVVLYNMSFSHVVDVEWIERLARAHTTTAGFLR